MVEMAHPVTDKASWTEIYYEKRQARKAIKPFHEALVWNQEVDIAL